MYDALVNFPGKVTTVANRANSIASVIFLGGSERLVTDPVQFVVHNAWMPPNALGDIMLNSQTLAQLKAEVEAVDEVLRNVYAKYTDADMKALMSVETNINTKELIEMGLATGVTESLQVKEQRSAALAYTPTYLQILNQSIKTEDMAELTDKVDGLERLFKGFMNIFKATTKNMVVSVEGGPTLYVYSEGELQGATVVIADADGNPTEESAPDGQHTLTSGEVVTVEGGVITAVEVAQSIEDLKAEMEKKDEEYQAILAEKDEEVKNLQNAFAQIKAEFDALKKEIPGKPSGNEPKIKNEISAEDWAKMTQSERIQYNLKNEFKK
jgi:hypothetical protein